MALEIASSSANQRNSKVGSGLQAFGTARSAEPTTADPVMVGTAVVRVPRPTVAGVGALMRTVVA